MRRRYEVSLHPPLVIYGLIFVGPIRSRRRRLPAPRGASNISFCFARANGLIAWREIADLNPLSQDFPLIAFRQEIVTSFRAHDFRQCALSLDSTAVTALRATAPELRSP